MRTMSLLLSLALAALPCAAQPTPVPCSEDSLYRAMDFWLGAWTVRVGDRDAGTNRVEAILDGCAVLEHWTDAAGSEGKSLFYVYPPDSTWKQVWVTEQARTPGGVKEKTLVARPGGALRFQGTIHRPGAPSFLDRTTLTPLPDGRVRQLIEISHDGGTTWIGAFDAVYLPGMP